MGQQSLGFEPERLEALAREAGFATATARSLPPEPKAKGPALLLLSGLKEKRETP